MIAPRPITSLLPACISLIARHVLAWSALCAVGAAGSYVDQSPLAQSRSYDAIFKSWLLMHIPVIVLGIAVSAGLKLHPKWLGQNGVLVTAYSLMVLLFMPVALLYSVWLDPGAVPGPQSLRTYWNKVLSLQRFDWFLELAWASGTCIAVVAMHARRQSRQRENALQRSSSELLQLRLALEQQRLETLRAQLEPHFLFNSLNAISALIRNSDQSHALSAMQQLGELLRYALAASTRDWVSLHEEIEFVERYLALQHLRYGDRLQIRIEGVDDASRMCEVPVLLLQPLVENAVRHDLDRHQQSSEIALCCKREGEQLTIEVSNPVSHELPPNPGMGLGLRNTEGRLRLLYGHAASLKLDVNDQQFCVRLLLPARAPEETVSA